jgi:hypothetical protein
MESSESYGALTCLTDAMELDVDIETIWAGGADGIDENDDSSDNKTAQSPNAKTKSKAKAKAKAHKHGRTENENNFDRIAETIFKRNALLISTTSAEYDCSADTIEDSDSEPNDIAMNTSSVDCATARHFDEYDACEYPSDFETSL